VRLDADRQHRQAERGRGLHVIAHVDRIAEVPHRERRATRDPEADLRLRIRGSEHEPRGRNRESRPHKPGHDFFLLVGRVTARGGFPAATFEAAASPEGESSTRRGDMCNALQGTSALTALKPPPAYPARSHLAEVSTTGPARGPIRPPARRAQIYAIHSRSSMISWPVDRPRGRTPATSRTSRFDEKMRKL